MWMLLSNFAYKVPNYADKGEGSNIGNILRTSFMDVL